MEQSGLDQNYMARALVLAGQAAAAGEVPVGAVLVSDSTIIAEGFNCPIGSKDPTAHAEMVVLREAARQLGNYRLPGATLYVTIEPCTMCIGAMIHSRIARLVYGAPEPRAGAVVSQLNLLAQPFYNHRIEYTGGVMAEESAVLLRDFFRRRR